MLFQLHEWDIHIVRRGADDASGAGGTAAANDPPHQAHICRARPVSAAPGRYLPHQARYLPHQAGICRTSPVTAAPGLVDHRNLVTTSHLPGGEAEYAVRS
jgi:hypothetical protein